MNFIGGPPDGWAAMFVLGAVVKCLAKLEAPYRGTGSFDCACRFASLIDMLRSG